MIWFLVAPLVGKLLKYGLTLAASLIVVILLGAPILGLLVQPMAPWWLGRQSTANNMTVVGGLGPIAGALPVIDAPAPTSTPVPSIVPLSGVAAVIEAAMTWLGVRYQWGGCSRSGIDCSCAVQTWWAVDGVHLPRTTVDQIKAVAPVSAAEARPGDLVFYDNTCSDCGANPTHVGLVLGAGKMVDAGDPVQIEPIFTGHNARYGRVR